MFSVKFGKCFVECFWMFFFCMCFWMFMFSGEEMKMFLSVFFMRFYWVFRNVLNEIFSVGFPECWCVCVFIKGVFRKVGMIYFLNVFRKVFKVFKNYKEPTVKIHIERSRTSGSTFSSWQARLRTTETFNPDWLESILQQSAGKWNIKADIASTKETHW